MMYVAYEYAREDVWRETEGHPLRFSSIDTIHHIMEAEDICEREIHIIDLNRLTPIDLAYIMSIDERAADQEYMVLPA